MENQWESIGGIMFNTKLKAFVISLICTVTFADVSNTSLVVRAFDSRTNNKKVVTPDQNTATSTHTLSQSNRNYVARADSINSNLADSNSTTPSVNIRSTNQPITNQNMNNSYLNSSNTMLHSESLNQVSSPQLPNTTIGQKDSPGVQNVTQPLMVKGLDSVDNDALTVNQMKRKLELQKLQAEFEKNKPKSNLNQDLNASSGVSPKPDENSLQTVVTDVMINNDTRQKFATLLFADGSTLDAEQGSKVDDYILEDVSMTGATLYKYNSKGKVIRKVHLKRVYGRADLGRQGSQLNTIFATPTQTLTTGNLANPFNASSNSGSSVPPIQ